MKGAQRDDAIEVLGDKKETFIDSSISRKPKVDDANERLRRYRRNKARKQRRMSQKRNMKRQKHTFERQIMFANVGILLSAIGMISLLIWSIK